MFIKKTNISSTCEIETKTRYFVKPSEILRKQVSKNKKPL